MRRLLKWLVILGVVVGLGVVATNSAKSWLKRGAETKYLTAKTSRGRVETVVNSTGTVKPVLSVSVGAFTSGPIKEVKVEFNSVVKKGDLLALIDPKLAEATVARDRAAVDAVTADLKRVEALLKQAENNLKRAEKLQAVNKDYVAETDMDAYYFTRLQNEALTRLGKASIAQAEATLENSLANLGYTKILAPVDGVVISRGIDPGQTVAASFQTPELFVIATEMDKHMYVYASVDEADIGQIRAAEEHGRVVKFTVDSFPGELFKGRVYQIRMNATTTQNVVTYPVVIESPNPGLKLMPGMTASISFQIEEKEDVLRVPAAALRFLPLPAQVRAEDRHYLDAQPTGKPEAVTLRSATEKAEQVRKRQKRVVWVQDGPTLRAIPVTLGLIDNQYAEVLEGELTEDQTVVIGTDNVK